MKSHAAKFNESTRLKKLHSVLSTGGIFSTARLQTETGSVAIHTDIHELRQNGYNISCHYLGKNGNGNKVYGYKLETANA